MNLVFTGSKHLTLGQNQVREKIILTAKSVKQINACITTTFVALQQHQTPFFLVTDIFVSYQIVALTDIEI